jgi:hypothetical protein
MQIGLVRDLPRMRDIYGATTVVPTRNEVQDAVAAVQRVYPGAQVARRRRPDPESFVYDDVHLLAALRRTAPGEPREVSEREFEIQVHTGLQFAWWRATHDKLYKGETQDWRLRRVVGQVRGNLEMLDGILADLDAGAKLIEPASDDLDEQFDEVIALLRHWPTSNRPTDLRAYAEAVTDLLSAGGLTAPGAEQLLASDRGALLVTRPDLTPVQVIAILVSELRGLRVLLRRGMRPSSEHRKRWLLITEEMEIASPLLSLIPEERRVRLTP